MSSGKKHRLEGEADAAQKVKKVKTNDPTAAEDAPVKEKKEKKEKKDKKDKSEKKKDKKEKKEKKEKKDKKDKKNKDKEQSEEQNGDDTAPADAMDVDVSAAAQVDEQLAAKKEKKDKKDKKSKEKKDKKKDRKPDDEATTETPVANGAPSKYQQSAALTAVPESEVKTFFEDNYITIHDQTNPSTTLRPVLKFSHLPTSRLLSKNPFGTFTTPTPIQAASWPFSLSGRDVVGIAETGSGKTYAFSLPCVEALLSLPKPTNNRIAPTRAVIVSPTRELAMQTHESTSTLASLVGLKAVCIYGGASKDDQRNLLRKGADIIVATPGRLKDFLSDGTISLSEAAFVVLDEADRMLDKGFEEDIKLIIGSCPAKEKRQTLMFTATWPSEVRGLAETFMVDPVKVIINKNKPGGETGDGNGNGTIELQANSRIAQTVEVVDPRGKERRLLEILKDAQRGKAHNDRILVFCLYKKETTRVEQFLTSRGLNVCAIHGDLRQEQRTRSLEAFKAGTTTIMLATDVAARGLDIPEVKLVVNLTVSSHPMLRRFEITSN